MTAISSKARFGVFLYFFLGREKTRCSPKDYQRSKKLGELLMLLSEHLVFVQFHVKLLQHVA